MSDPESGGVGAGGERVERGVGDGSRRGPFERPGTPTPRPPRYGRFVGLLAVVILALITINTLVTRPNGGKGLAAGAHLPPFAVPLATSNLTGYADVATVAGQGARHAACELRGPKVLNICELYEHAPVVLVLFVELGSCAAVLSDVQSLVGDFPGVRFAAVALRGSQQGTRRVVRSRGLTFPVGFDEGGALAGLYKVASCPQVTFAYPGGEAQSAAYLGRPSAARLRERVQALVAATRGR